VDRAEIERALGLLVEPGSVVELVVPATDDRERLAGFYDDVAALARDATEWNGRTHCVCVSLNPMDPRRLAGARNLLRIRHENRELDGDCLGRRWFPVDVDPRRETWTSSTDTEHDAALACARRVRGWLASLGWSEPILADSGNGGHLLYRIDLPNSPDVTQLVERALSALELRFGDASVAIDASVSDAARGWKVYGTLAAKGEDTPVRPHRLSHLLEVPPRLRPVPVEMIAMLPRTPPPRMEEPDDLDRVHLVRNRRVRDGRGMRGL
jgi:hypothetical protein